MSDPEHARTEVRLCGRMVEERRSVACQLGCIERVLHDQEHVHVLRLELARDERSEYHEARQMIGRLGEAIDTVQAEGEDFSLRRTDAELVEDLSQRCAMHTER